MVVKTRKKTRQVLLVLLLLLVGPAVSACGGSDVSPPLIPHDTFYLPVSDLRMEDDFGEGAPLSFSVTLLWPYVHQPRLLEVLAEVVSIGESMDGDTVVRMQFLCSSLSVDKGPLSRVELVFPDELQFGGGSDYWKRLNSLAAGDYRLEFFGPERPTAERPDMLHPVIVKEFVVLPEGEEGGD